MDGSPTAAESQLANWLRVTPPYGVYRWKRQVVLYGYIVDFYLPQLRVALEVDGPIHELRQTYDRVRDGHLRARGIHVLRLNNEQVKKDPFGCLDLIREVCREAFKAK